MFALDPETGLRTIIAIHNSNLGPALGGGKSVIIGDPHSEKRPELLHAMGRWIDSLDGRYITGEDIGTNPDDMAEIKKTTRYVTCLHEKDGGYGDPAPMTALGVISALRAGIEATLGTSDLAGVRVALQGVGNVGRNLCRLLADAGGVLNDDTIPRLKARVVAGGANNQLGRDRHGEMLAERDIVYLPDYVANGGGLICVAADRVAEERFGAS